MGICIRRSKKKVLLNVVMHEIHGNMTVNYVKMKGLCAGQLYLKIKYWKNLSGRGADGWRHAALDLGEYQAYQIVL